MNSQTLRIAQKELQFLLYSPVGWIVLIVFWIQVASSFLGSVDGGYIRQVTGFPPSSYASFLFMDGPEVLYRDVRRSIFLYIPLLTMATFSRELQSQSIKLFLSSPVRMWELVLGKYLAVCVFLLGFVFAILATIFATWYFVPNLDLLALLPGLLGIYLLALCFAAIGVFVSSLTQHQIVAAIATLGVLFVLSSIGTWFASVQVLNEATYWASITGRFQDFRAGLITSQNVVYFLLLTALFLALTVLRTADLRVREKRRWLLGKSIGILALVLVFGWFFSRPEMRVHVDMTADLRNTLAPESSQLMRQIEGPWEITTFANLFSTDGSVAWPRFRIPERERYSSYTRINPELQMTYRNYYAVPIGAEGHMTADQQKLSVRARRQTEQLNVRLDGLVDEEVATKTFNAPLRSEQFRTFRVVSWNERSAPLRFFDDLRRFPDERTRAAAISRLLHGPMTIGVLSGSGERSATTRSPEDFDKLMTRLDHRFSLVNHGFEVAEIGVGEGIPENTDILVIADPRTSYSRQREADISDFLERGGNLLLLVERETDLSIDWLLEKFGLERRGSVFQNHIREYPESFVFGDMSGGVLNAYWGEANLRAPVGLDGALQIAVRSDIESFSRQEILTADNLVDAQGEPIGKAAIGYALHRSLEGETQRVVIIGDADIASTMMSDRQDPQTIEGAFDTFHWLSGSRYPVKLTEFATIDNRMDIDRSSLTYLKWLFYGVVPILILVLSSALLYRRKQQ